MYDEVECIYYNNGKCKFEEENEGNEPIHYNCEVCNDKHILKEGEEIEVTEHYTLTRKNGKLKKL